VENVIEIVKEKMRDYKISREIEVSFEIRESEIKDNSSSR
jgi:hypothetical protein